MSLISDNLSRVHQRIAAAARSAGRPIDSIQLLAVSKGKSPGEIAEAYALGQRRFGENYAQELASKAAALARYPDIEWHFIGHLQSNKAKMVAPIAYMIHTVDSPSLAKELGQRVLGAGRAPLRVLIEVNVAKEPQKNGVLPSGLQDVIEAVRREPSLELSGLMTVPPAGSLDETKQAFETLVSLRSIHGGLDSLPDLSMGMSHDLELAIATGATMVRIGTAIFGPRG
jgi:pyridoxal phosphate enzyme (YggS family)